MAGRQSSSGGLYPNLRSEYSDATLKLNRKEDIMLQRRLLALHQQERAAHGALQRATNDVLHLRQTALADCRSVPANQFVQVILSHVCA